MFRRVAQTNSRYLTQGDTISSKREITGYTPACVCDTNSEKHNAMTNRATMTINWRSPMLKFPAQEDDV